MISRARPVAAPFPDRPKPFEEVCAAVPADTAAALLFALSRRGSEDGRPILIAAPRAWFTENGRPYGPGLLGLSLILAPVSTPAEALWALEQGLRSGALSLAVGPIDGATLAQSRRLDFAARQGEATGVLMPRALDSLSAASRRWRITTFESALDRDDPKAAGPARLKAELTRARSERPGQWLLEQDDETHRLRLADRLADFGQAAIAGAGAAAGLAA